MKENKMKEILAIILGVLSVFLVLMLLNQEPEGVSCRKIMGNPMIELIELPKIEMPSPSPEEKEEEQKGAEETSEEMFSNEHRNNKAISEKGSQQLLKTSVSEKGPNGVINKPGINTPGTDVPGMDKPDDPSRPEPDDPSQPEPDDPSQPEPDDPSQPEPDDPSRPDKGTLLAKDFIITTNGVYDGTSKAENAYTILEGVGKITTIYKKDGREVNPVNAGEYDIFVSVMEGEKYHETQLLIGKLVIAKAKWPSFTISAKESVFIYNGRQQEPEIVGVSVGLNYRIVGERTTVGPKVLTAVFISSDPNYEDPQSQQFEIRIVDENDPDSPNHGNPDPDDGEENQGNGNPDGEENQGNGNPDGEENQGNGNPDGEENQGNGNPDGEENQGNGNPDGEENQGTPKQVNPEPVFTPVAAPTEEKKEVNQTSSAEEQQKEVPQQQAELPKQQEVVEATTPVQNDAEEL